MGLYSSRKKADEKQTNVSTPLQPSRDSGVGIFDWVKASAFKSARGLYGGLEFFAGGVKETGEQLKRGTTLENFNENFMKQPEGFKTKAPDVVFTEEDKQKIAKRKETFQPLDDVAKKAQQVAGAVVQPVGSYAEKAFEAVNEGLDAKANDWVHSFYQKPFTKEDGSTDWGYVLRPDVSSQYVFEVAGQMLPALATAYVSGGTAPIAVYMGGVELGQSYEDFSGSLAEQEGISVEELTDEQKEDSFSQAFLYAGVSAYLETRLFAGVEKTALRPIRSMLQRAIKEVPLDMLKSGLIEGGTEGLQQFSQNFIAKKGGSDPDRNLMEGVLESAYKGFVSGLAFGMSTNFQAPRGTDAQINSVADLQKAKDSYAKEFAKAKQTFEAEQTAAGEKVVADNQLTADYAQKIYTGSKFGNDAMGEGGVGANMADPDVAAVLFDDTGHLSESAMKGRIDDIGQKLEYNISKESGDLFRSKMEGKKFKSIKEADAAFKTLIGESLPPNQSKKFFAESEKTYNQLEKEGNTKIKTIGEADVSVANDATPATLERGAQDPEFNNFVEQITKRGKIALKETTVSLEKLNYEGFSEADFGGEGKSANALAKVKAGDISPLVIDFVDGKLVIKNGNHTRWALGQEGIENAKVVISETALKESGLETKVAETIKSEEVPKTTDKQTDLQKKGEDIQKTEELKAKVDKPSVGADFVPRESLTAVYKEAERLGAGETLAKAITKPLTGEEIERLSDMQIAVVNAGLSGIAQNSPEAIEVINQNIQALGGTAVETSTIVAPTEPVSAGETPTESEVNIKKTEIEKAEALSGRIAKMDEDVATADITKKEEALATREVQRKEISASLRKGADTFVDVKAGKKKASAFTLSVKKLPNLKYGYAITMNTPDSTQAIDYSPRFSSEAKAKKMGIQRAIRMVETARQSGVSKAGLTKIKTALMKANKTLGKSALTTKKVKKVVKETQKKLKTKKEKQTVYKSPVKQEKLTKILRGTKGLTAEDIQKKLPNIKLKKDVPAKDIHGNKVIIPEDEVLTPYELKGNKILLQDGKTYIVSKNQFANIKGNSVGGEVKPFAPELKEIKESVKSDKVLVDEIDVLSEKMFGKKFEDLTPKKRREVSIERNQQSWRNPKSNTKYSELQLPGGKNYKEIIIQAKLDIKTAEKLGYSVKPAKGETVSGWRVHYPDGSWQQFIHSSKELAEAEMLRTVSLHEKAYPSPHWEEIKNVLAHIRMNMRKFKGKTVAFLEELQSDWAREGREKGFDLYDVVSEIEDDTLGSFATKKEAEDFAKEQSTEETKYKVIVGDGVPNNQFLKKWQEMSIKRALIEAVNSKAGYFAWINGEQTSARYNLDTVVDSIKWEKDDSSLIRRADGVKNVIINPKDGSSAFNILVDKDGKIISSVYRDWNGKKLDEALGKGLADKVMGEETGTLLGEGLKFGGEWTSNLYDKQVKNIVEDLTGGKVEVMDMGLPVAPEGSKIFNIQLSKTGKPVRLTEKNMKIGKTIFTSEGAGEYVITDILGEGAFKAVEKVFYDNMKARWKDLENDPNWKLKLSVAERKFNVLIKKVVQQGIKLTPEIKAKIKGKTLGLKNSGKMFASKENSKGATPISEFEELPKIEKEFDANAKKFKLHEKSIELIRKYAARIGEGNLPRGTAGVFWHGTNTIRTRSLTEISVVAHEIAHYLDFVKTNISDAFLGDNKGLQSDLDEIYVEYYHGASLSHPRRLRVVEGFATLLQKYAEMPTTMETTYPDLINAFFKEGGDFYNPLFAEIIADLRNIVGDYQALKPLDKIAARMLDGELKVDKKIMSLSDKIKSFMADFIYPTEALSKKVGKHFTSDDLSLWMRLYNTTLPTMISNNILGRSAFVKGYSRLVNGEVKQTLKYNWSDLVKKLKGSDNAFGAFLIGRTIFYEYKDLGNSIELNESKKFEIVEMSLDLDILTAKLGRARNKDVKKGIREEINGIKTDLAIAKQSFEERQKVIEESTKRLKKDQIPEEEATNAFEQGKALYEEETKMFDALTSEDLKFANDPAVQLLTNKEFSRLNSKEGYAPLKRAFYDEILGTNENLPKHMRMTEGKISSLKKRTGSPRVIINPVAAAILNHSEFTKKGLQQIVRNKAIDYAELAPDVIEIVPLKAYKDENTGLIVFPQESKKEIIMARKDYKRVPLLVDSTIKQIFDNVLTHESVDDFGKFMMSSSRLFSKGTTGLYTQFIVPNLMLDQISAAAQSSNNYIPFYTATKTLYKTLSDKNSPESELALEYLRLGGERQTAAGWLNQSPEELSRTIRKENKGIERIVKFIDRTGDVVGVPATYSEMGSRMVEYIMSRKKGEPQVVALERAGRVTAPFHHVGSWTGSFGQTFIKSIPFFNPAIQVVAQAAETLNSPKGRQKYLMVVAAVSAAQIGSLGLILAGGSDEQKRKYAGIHPDMLANYLYLPNPTNKTDLIKLRIPSQFSVLSVAMNMVIADKFLGADYKFGEYYDGVTAFIPDQLNPGNLLSTSGWAKLVAGWLPQLLKIPTQLMFNKRVFPEVMPLEGYSLEKKLPSERYLDSTSKGAKMLGKAFGLSPVKLDFFMEGFFGRYIGYMTIKPSAYNLRKVYIQEEYFNSSRQVKKYFDMKEENDQRYTTYKGNPDKKVEFARAKKKREELNKVADYLKKFKEVDEEKLPIKAEAYRQRIFSLINKL